MFKNRYLTVLRYGSPILAAMLVLFFLGIWQSSNLNLRVASGGAPRRIAASCTTTVNSDIGADTTWSSADSPVCVTTIVNVVPSAALTIQPGVTVYGSSDAALVIRGSISALGTSGSPIVFTSDADSGSGQWLGMVIDGNDGIGRGTLSYVTVRDGGQLYLGSNTNLRVVSGGSLSVDHSTIADSSGLGIMADVTSSLTFTNNTVQNNGAYGLSAPLSSLKNVLNNTFTGNTPNRILIIGSPLGVQ